MTHHRRPILTHPRQSFFRVSGFNSPAIVTRFDNITVMGDPVQKSSGHFVVAAQTGLRQSNIVGLTLPQLDFTRNLIIVPRTKNGEPVCIPMTSVVRSTLLKVLQERTVASSYVFCDEAGQPHTGRKVSMAFKRACERAGIVNLRFHDLRHDFATSLVQAGVDLYRVQKLCGHKDQRMTQRYAHLLPETLREAISVIDSSGTTATILLQSEEPGKEILAVSC